MRIDPNRTLYSNRYRNYDIYYDRLSNGNIDRSTINFDYIMSCCAEEIDFAYFSLSKKILTYDYNPKLFHKAIKLCFKNTDYLCELLCKKILTEKYNQALFKKAMLYCIFSKVAFRYIFDLIEHKILIEKNKVFNYFDSDIQKILRVSESYIYFILNDKESLKDKLTLKSFLNKKYKDKDLLKTYKIPRRELNKHNYSYIWRNLMISLAGQEYTAFLLLAEDRITSIEGIIYKSSLDTCYKNLDYCFRLIQHHYVTPQNNSEYYYKYILKILKFGDRIMLTNLISPEGGHLLGSDIRDKIKMRLKYY